MLEFRSPDRQIARSPDCDSKDADGTLVTTVSSAEAAVRTGGESVQLNLSGRAALDGEIERPHPDEPSHDISASLSVIVPCYNEAPTVVPLLCRSAKRYLQPKSLWSMTDPPTARTSWSLR
ncbi:MAG: hypothetical protein KatS3mg111_0457 [Pirellulaceae bacterium]|nr:MAG: hypothetical protein KatS3mg111_0457 [Pirellulaceae bacterium]